jgi:tRNA A-37 threonylcarbamoyl transferase component Bud32
LRSHIHRVTSGIPADLAAALDERYELRGLLGRGGMATVYLAYDRKHHRVVALKVLRPELAASIGAERFLKEIQIVAQLTHPHILALHDSGEAGAFVYYVMPHITGGSLRQRLLEQGAMNPAGALAIAAPVADALSYAHGMGVLHRDIKPENILFSHGHPVVGDFGIAKAVSSASETQLTRTGLSLGTPGYMSPEQAAGVSDLDVRTDVYSLAVVIYEMLVGEVPGRWPTEDAVRAGRFLEAPAGHRFRLTSSGTTIEGALVRGLAIRQDQRTASPAMLLDELKGSEPRRRFRSEEAVEIVKRAADLEATNPTSIGAMTLGGVEALGAEVGIAPELVRSAARGMAGRSTGTEAVSAPVTPPATNLLAGGPTRISYERTIQGELPESEFAYVVEEIRRAMGSSGQVNQLGRSFTWIIGRTATRRDLEISVSVRAGRTRITVNESLSQLVGGVYGSIGGGMGGGGMGMLSAIFAGVLHSPGAIVVAIPVWLLLTFATARTTYSYASRRRDRQLAQIADRVAAVVEKAIGPVVRLNPLAPEPR